MSKLIYAKSKTGFEIAFDSIARTLGGSVYNSVVFTEDGYIFTHGKYFRILPNDATQTIKSGTASSGTVSITDYNGVALGSINVGVTSVTTSGIISGTLASGAIAIAHSNSSLAATTLGASAAANTTISVPKIITDQYGHVVTGSTHYTATLNNVLTETSTSANAHYITFSADSSNSTNKLAKSASLSYVPSTGALSATKFVGTLNYSASITLNGTATAFNNTANTSVSFYAPTTAGTAGQILISSGSGAPSWLSASQTVSSGSTDSQIPTAKAVWDAVTSGMAVADAMVYKGTIGTGGTYTIAAFDTLATYNAGWTYRVITAGTIRGYACEIGDLLVAVVDRVGSGSVNSDWSVVQTNIDGAVVGPSSSTNGAVVLFDGTTGKLIKDSAKVLTTIGGNLLSLANPSAQRYLRTETANTVTAITAATLKSDLALNNVENTALTTWHGTGTIDTVGTISTGSWAATDVALAHGGTNASLTASAGAIVYSTASAMAFSAVGTANYVLLSGGTSAPTWSAQSSLSVGSATTATKLAGGAAGSIPYQNGVGSTVFLAATTSNGYVLKYNTSTSAPYWAADINTDTHWTAHLITGASSEATANASVSSNGSVYLNLVEDGSVRNAHNIVGTGATSVTCDSNGKIAIDSTNSWRNVTAYSIVSPTTPVEILASSIGTDDLQFGSEFLWDNTNKEIKMGWAEVSAAGAITYAY